MRNNQYLAPETDAKITYVNGQQTRPAITRTVQCVKCLSATKIAQLNIQEMSAERKSSNTFA